MERVSLPAVAAAINVHRTEAAANGDAASDLRLRAALAFAAPLLLFAASAQQRVGYWDVGEMDTVPYILGIAHPPGYPLYTLIGWAWAHLLPFGSVAFRMSLLSAVAMAACSLCVYRIVLDEANDEDAALLAAWLFAVVPAVWQHAVRAEPHAFATLAFLITVLFVLRWYRSGNDAELYGAAIAFGLGVAVHPIVALMLPGIIVLIIARLHETQGLPLFRAAILAVASAAVWFAYFPLRSAYVTSEHLDPVAALGLVGSAFWDYDHPLVLNNLLGLVMGRDVDVPGGLSGALKAAAGVGVVAVLYGAFRFARTDLMKSVGLFALVVPSVGFAFGFSDEVDIARYFLPALALLVVLAGIGLAGLSRTSRLAFGGRLRLTTTVAMLVVIGGLLVANSDLFAQRHDDRAEHDVDLVLATTPSDAILIANWTIAPPLAYAAYVEHRAEQRVVVAAWPVEVADLVPSWSQRRPVYVVERSPSHVRIHRLTH